MGCRRKRQGELALTAGRWRRQPGGARQMGSGVPIEPAPYLPAPMRGTRAPPQNPGSETPRNAGAGCNALHRSGRRWRQRAAGRLMGRDGAIAIPPMLWPVRLSANPCHRSQPGYVSSEPGALLMLHRLLQAGTRCAACASENMIFRGIAAGSQAAYSKLSFSAARPAARQPPRRPLPLDGGWRRRLSSASIAASAGELAAAGTLRRPPVLKQRSPAVVLALPQPSHHTRVH